MATTSPNERLTKAQAAAEIGCSERTLERLQARGDGPAFVRATPRLVFYLREDLERWLESRRIEPGGSRRCA